MCLAIRATGLAFLVTLAATVVVLRPGSEPPAATAAQPAVLPADLALVPADAVGFVHIRAAELWKNEALAQFRQTFEKAGPKVLTALDNQFVPKISTLDRVTGFLLSNGDGPPPLPFVVFRFSAPFDEADVVNAYMPKAEKMNLAGKTVYSSKQVGFDLYFPDKQHIVLAPDEAFGVYFTYKFPQSGPMSQALKLAAAGKPLVGSVKLSSLPIPASFIEDLPPDAKSLLKAEHITASLELGAAAKVEVIAGYKNAADADDAEKAIKALAEHARKEVGKMRDELEKKFLGQKGPRPVDELPEAVFNVFILGALNHVDELLANPGQFVKRDGTTLTASVSLPKELVVAVGGIAGIGAAMLMPAVQKVRGSAARMTSMNNLKQLAIAMHNYHDAMGHFPQDIVDKNGKPLLSWRVAILPYIEQDNLYKQFKLDEPWDSANNKQASQAVVKTFLSPRIVDPNPAGKTHYKAFVGSGTAFEPGKKIKITDITDGTSNTIMLVETADAIEWAKPGDIPFDPKKPLPKLTSIEGDDVILVALCDGSVRAINLKKVGEKTLKAAIIRNDGEVLGDDWDQ
ncbi:MAG: DUF1559 domain-containing protein [Gemmataceae bacterium]